MFTVGTLKCAEKSCQMYYVVFEDHVLSLPFLFLIRADYTTVTKVNTA